MLGAISAFRFSSFCRKIPTQSLLVCNSSKGALGALLRRRITNRRSDDIFRVKIISGGQTGADRAALNWAIAHAVPHGGWCPAGRKAEDGVIDARYNLTETESAQYGARTRRNVDDSDATLIANLGELEGGSLKTLRLAERLGKPVRVIQLEGPPDSSEFEALAAWLRATGVEILNIAGPRESKRPGIYSATWNLLDRLFAP